MALETYRAKRNFRETPEPPPRTVNTGRRPIFVIQEHHASRLHYDFRLEAEGVLKSWAVPKEPTLDPSQKRLAVHVEDHPVPYAKFHGTIPQGQYGAGEVKIWDQGTYENLLAEKAVPQTVAQGIDAGRLEFVLHGRKLQGRFALVRMKAPSRGKENWLLIKMRDEFARPDTRATASPSTITPFSHSDARARKSDLMSDRPAADKSSTNGRDLAFTHTDKVFFPDSRITKGDVLDYYRRISSRLLPYLRDRPATLERIPEGLAGPKSPHFWQKDTPAYYPDWIPRADLPTERGKPVHYALVNDQRTLLYLVNQGAITFHVGFSRMGNLDHPDFVLFDLDPGPASFADTVAVARQLHQHLDSLERTAYIKTSGKTGLHVLIPWNDPGDYDTARAWALDVANQTVEALPEIATTQRSKARRGKRVYIDVMQNAFGHHAVPPYVIRAVPGAPVSMPLTWRELNPNLNPAQFNVKTVFRRLAHRKSDPTAGLLRSRRRPARH